MLLARVSDELLAGIDSLAVSVYPDRRPDDALLEHTRERCRKTGVRMRVEWIDRFRKTQTVMPVEDSGLLDGIFRSCLIAHAWSCQTIYDGYFYLCSRPIYTDTYLRGVGQPTRDLRRVDGVALHEPGLLERLKTYLESGKPLESCRHCLGTVGHYEPHAQLASRERWHPRPLVESPANKVDGARLRSLLRWQRLAASLLRRLPSRRLSRALAVAQTAFLGD